MSELFAAKLGERFGGREHEGLSLPRYRLHVFTSRGVRALARDGRLRTPLGYLGAFASNAVSRRAMGGFLERVIFSDPRDRLPVPTHDYRTHHVELAENNLGRSILANVVLLSPSPEWVATLPGSKIPDRSDFMAFGDDHDARERLWTRATAESGRLAEEFEALTRQPSVEAMPLP
ncbi:MAG: hypothetical protein H7276_08705 [Caulobacter sp.]|nr:hypothetical protein [Vitreoscilla sp.]